MTRLEVERPEDSWKILRRQAEWIALNEGLDNGVGLNEKRSQGKLPVIWLDHFLASD